MPSVNKYMPLMKTYALCKIFIEYVIIPQNLQSQIMSFMYKRAARVLLAYLAVFALHTIAERLREQELQELQIWRSIFEQIQQQQNQSLVRNKYMKKQYNESRYNLKESEIYCEKSDAYKMVHPDVFLTDKYVWRDYSIRNLQTRIVFERTYAILPGVLSSKDPGPKKKFQIPIELTFMFTSVSSLWNNYDWGKGLGCTFQKYSHLPGKSSVAQKNQLIENFMTSIRGLNQRQAGSDCVVNSSSKKKRNASFIPETYRLNDRQDCLAFFNALNSEETNQRFQTYGPQYIIKTNAHRGNGITVLFENATKEIIEKYQNGTQCGKEKRVAIAQKYISNPFLYKGHKIEFRIYFFIESTMPIIAYSYKRALIKRCAKPFSVHSTDKAAHVCNTAIVTKTTGLKEDYHNNEDHDDVEEEEFFIDWNLEGLQELLIKDGRISNDNWLEEYLYPRIHRSLIHMVRSTQYTFVRDSRFSEFFAVDFLLDNDLEVWVLEVNYNPQILSVTPDRIERNFKMVEDTLEIHFAYVRSKYLRLLAYLKQHIYQRVKENESFEFWQDHYEALTDLQKDRLDATITISKDNLYVKIIDEGLPGTQAYDYLIESHCL